MAHSFTNCWLMGRDELQELVSSKVMPVSLTIRSAFHLQRDSFTCGVIIIAPTHIFMNGFLFIFSKIQNYSPTEAAKVYDKPLTRKTLVKFNPESVLNMMKSSKAHSDLDEMEEDDVDDRQDREKVVDDYLEVCS